MTSGEVESLIGIPVRTEFYGDVLEWHYCKTGFDSDQMMALFFYEGKLIEKRHYTVTLFDTGGAGGNCAKFIKMGNYRVPDSVVEIRNR